MVTDMNKAGTLVKGTERNGGHAMTNRDPHLRGTDLSAKESPDMLTIPEVAQILRCSKAHVCNLVNDKVRNAPRLPAIRLGRRILIRRETLELWKLASEERPRSML
jgi:excisionase family DNA binding protein